MKEKKINFVWDKFWNYCKYMYIGFFFGYGLLVADYFFNLLSSL